MKHYYTAIILVLISNVALNAQSYSIKGQVMSKEEAIPFATVSLKNTTIATTTNLEGFFELSNLENDTYELLISNVGYKSFYKKIDFNASNSIDLGQISLQEDIFGLTEVVVTGTMKETFVGDSPIKVDVITSKYLEQTVSPTNLVEAIQMVNGVQEVTACGVCFTNSISINGLPGPYTAVLIDGAPMFGNLASVYGLNGIPTTIIDRFEVIKGPSSTLYGSEAVAGVINIITKKPENQPLVAVDIMGTSHLESFGNLSFSPRIGDYYGTIGLNYAYIDNFDDKNGDGFSDVINMDRVSIFTKWQKKRTDKKQSTIAAKLYYEDRRNGVEAFLTDRAYQELRGDDAVYGESIYTNRLEVFGKYELPTNENLTLNYSYSYHDQDSYYGSDNYLATQHIGFTNFVWNKIIGNHDLLGGLTLRYQYYDDNTVATTLNGKNQADNQFIPGVFLQDEWLLSDKFTTLLGARLDHYDEHGLIFAPRVNLKYKPEPWTTFRLNFGTGFRVVNLFTEDHAFISGNRSVEILEDLEPESSYNLSLNFNHIFNIKNTQGSLDVDAYYTYFQNAIFPDYNDPTKIIYANSDGFAVTRGISLSLNQQFGFPLSYNIGFNLQEAFQTETNNNGDKVSTDIEFAPSWSSVASLSYKIKPIKLDIAYTINFTGQMQLPEVFDLDANGNPLEEARPTTSEPFAFQNLQITKTLKKDWKVFVGIQNLFNYTQQTSPLIGYNDPNNAVGFSPYFDTSYAYAPIHGREIYIGVKWNYK
ncbi:MAG: TonB-dependent receptor [Saprospiraceae bacterium]